MTCREVSEFLIDYLEGRLAPAERAVFETHLGVCDACRAYLSSYETTIRLSRDAMCAPDGDAQDEIPEDLIRAILLSRSSLAK